MDAINWHQIIQVILTRVEYNSWGMFCACTGLDSFDVSNFDMRNDIDISSIFYHCESLE